MTVFLDRIDSSPLANINDFNYQFIQWVWILVDSLNEDISNIQDAFNLLTAQGYTQTQITDMDAAGDLEDGVLLYDTDNNVYVGRQAGSLVQFTTAAYP